MSLGAPPPNLEDQFDELNLAEKALMIGVFGVVLVILPISWLINGVRSVARTVAAARIRADIEHSNLKDHFPDF